MFSLIQLGNKFFQRILLFSILFLLCMPRLAYSDQPTSINWQDYNAASFTAARNENKLLLLDLKANWCHWCHVMDQKTYANPEVIRYLNQHYIAMKVDHDARPDLAERYRKWGWPATIILTADGEELHKQAGFIAADDFIDLIQTRYEQPLPSQQTLRYPEQVADSATIHPKLKQRLQQRHLESFDQTQGSLKLKQKFIDPGAVLWDLQLAKQGDQSATQRLQLTLDNALLLLDPVFGGAYQYSTHGDWLHPHYEKIMAVQSIYLQIYSQAYELFQTPKYLQAAENVADYLHKFMSDPNGGFYTSQDADLIQGQKAHAYFRAEATQRLAQGVPRIDKNQYSAENGLAIDGLLYLYQASKNEHYLAMAAEALKWVETHRQLGKGYRHAQQDLAGPYLADTLNMAIAWLHLYQISALPASLNKAQQAAEFINLHFRHPQAGLISATDNGTPIAPLPQLDQNIRAANFFLALYQQDRQSQWLHSAEHILLYLNTPQVALSRLTDAGILLVNQRYSSLKSQLTKRK